MREFFVKHPIIASLTILTVADTMANTAVAVAGILKGCKEVALPRFSFTIGSVDKCKCDEKKEKKNKKCDGCSDCKCEKEKE